MALKLKKSRGVIEVDLNARILSAEEPIYVLFPGEGYSLFETMRRKNVLVLDFPGLPLGDAKKFADLDQAVERMAMAVRIRNWHRAGRPSDTKPSRVLADYKRHTVTERRGLYLGALEALIFTAKPGTLVVVPGPGHWGEVLVGEVIGQRTSVTDPAYGDEPLPARRVRWLSRKPKAAFSEELITRLPTPNPFTLLDKSYREEVLRATFDNFVYGGKFVSKFSTSKTSFNVLDEYRIQSFMNLVAGAFIASDGSEYGEGSIDLEAALEVLAANPELIPELTLNINSPGFQRLISDGVAPFVVAVALALATAGCDDVRPQDIRVINSAAGPANDCTIDVGDSVKDTFVFMNENGWKAACKRIRDAAEDTGITTTVRAERHP